MVGRTGPLELDRDCRGLLFAGWCLDRDTLRRVAPVPRDSVLGFARDDDTEKYSRSSGEFLRRVLTARPRDLALRLTVECPPGIGGYSRAHAFAAASSAFF